MKAIDLIEKKKNNKELTYKELKELITSYLKDEVPEYQMSAFLMAVFFQGMSDNEIDNLTKIMIESGDTIDLSAIEGVKVDKHSTGGVGDSTTLILGPILSACGLKFAKMSGRGLGHTGGTLDKLESIPGFSIEMDVNEIIDATNSIGIAIAGQSGNITPADKKLYALRDSSATVDSIPLIASSIMSKKLAISSDVLLLDVKVGEGAFMKTLPEARKLAQELVRIGESFGRRTVAILTSMSQPLGKAIGNGLEVKEAIEILKGNSAGDLEDLCIYLAAKIMELSGFGNFEEAKIMATESISSGKALEKLKELIKSQHGNGDIIEDYNLFPQSEHALDILAPVEGYINALPARLIGNLARDLGAGRLSLEDTLDLGAGIYLESKCGDYVEKNQVIARFYGNDKKTLEEKAQEFLKIINISDKKQEVEDLILAEVDHGA